ncbi:MAG: hypothetical protein WAU70_14940 [Flavobacteriales bacterium]
MHTIEPYWNWRHRYMAEEDERSPFHGREYSEFEFQNAVYDHVLHPQWDGIGSETLYIKILFADYDDGYCIIEMIGEWNDLLHNDIMLLKRDIVEQLMAHGLHSFILIGENVLNFHSSDDTYYQEWWEECEDAGGWIALLNFREHVLADMRAADLDRYFISGGKLDAMDWRTANPEDLYERVKNQVVKRLGA